MCLLIYYENSSIVLCMTPVTAIKNDLCSACNVKDKVGECGDLINFSPL